MTALGSNAHIFAQPRRRQDLRWAFETALGCGPVATVEYPGIAEPMLVVRFTDGGSLSIEFTDQAPDDDHPRFGAWLELRAGETLPARPPGMDLSCATARNWSTMAGKAKSARGTERLSIVLPEDAPVLSSAAATELLALLVENGPQAGGSVRAEAFGGRLSQQDSGQTLFAFYGRVSTEDNQDAASSRAWQLTRSRALIEPRGGVIAAEFFDIDKSRSIPW